MATNQTILIIDDIEENIDLLERLLDKEGYKTYTAKDAAKGLHLLKDNSFDLVLLDINMPVINGITLLENIRKDSSLSNVAVIMVTAKDDAETTLKCLKLGACGYITKPFNMEQLQKQINHCVN
jgi:DNA-binding response OmpR family regulator